MANRPCHLLSDVAHVGHSAVSMHSALLRDADLTPAAATAAAAERNLAATSVTELSAEARLQVFSLY